MRDADVLVIGGGIAGVGAAFELSAFTTVVLLEQEAQCGAHATGRSAASFTQTYGGAITRRLAGASRSFLEQPPPGFAAAPLLTPRGTLTIGRADQRDQLDEAFNRARAFVADIQRLDPEAARARVPILRPEAVAAGALYEPGAMDLDVHGLHGGYLAGARRRGARVLCKAGVQAIARDRDGWCMTTAAGEIRGRILLNAAGAWADAVAALAGIAPLGLVPKKRTAFLIPLPDGLDARGWPLVDDVGEQFYFKHDAGQLFVSPSDATPSEPGDVFADEMDIAIGAERLEKATTLQVRRVARAWAGLRTFAADTAPVVGADPDRPDFMWLAGQGGTGLKTAPALSRACAGLIQHGRLPDDLLRAGLTAADLAPGRLRGTTLHGTPA